jgi:hypothetical protein
VLVSVSAALALSLIGGEDAFARHDKRAEGRYHLKKANGLAGQGKCIAAVREYTLAYQRLQDPVVLFNRAECYRRLGEGAKAAADYRGFLKGVPNAHNRADIEARIAGLERPAGHPAPPPSPKPPARKPEDAVLEPSEETAPPHPGTGPHVAKAPAEPRPPKAPPEARAPAKPPAEARPPLKPPAEPRAPLALAGPEPVGTGAAPALVTAPAPASVEAPRARARSRWWIWAVGSALVAGAAATTYLVLRPHPADIPSTDLGNFRF